MKQTKLGVVLSGGGAKGAYEVGFLKALAEFNIQPDVIAGTSIGALNGAIYASKKDTKLSASLLEKLWNDLGSSNVLEVDKGKAIKNLVEVFTYFSPMPVTKLAKVAMAFSKAGKSQEGILTQIPIVDRLKQYAPENELENGLPFYIGLTKSKGNAKDFINFAGFGNEESEFKRIQELKKEGCTHIIVCHLNEGSFFNRYDPLFKDVTIIEVRPKANTFSSVLDPLQFKVEKIDEWRQQGYNDSKRILSEAFEALLTQKNRIVSENIEDNAVNRLTKRKFILS